MQKVSLPYIDNAKAVLVTVAVNLGVVFLFYWPNGVTYPGVLVDSLICAAITTAIDLWMVYTRLRKLRSFGQIPSEVPINGLIQRLPQNPWALGVIFAAVFGVLTAGVNAAILWFFGLRSMAFLPWVVYKLVYTTVLSAGITQYCVFRYVQPDWARAKSAKEADKEPQTILKPVRDPMPRVSVFKAMYGSVTGNIATNMVVGLVLGGVTAAEDGSVTITPTTVEGIPITGLIFGFLVGFLTTRSIVKEMNMAILAPGYVEPQHAVLDKRFSWMPKGKGALTLFICLCMMIFSAVVLWVLMTLFDIAVMNIYQYAVFISVYASIVSKPLSCVLVRRCTQPDYIRYTLNKAKS